MKVFVCAGKAQASFCLCWQSTNKNFNTA